MTPKSKQAIADMVNEWTELDRARNLRDFVYDWLSLGEKSGPGKAGVESAREQFESSFERKGHRDNGE